MIMYGYYSKSQRDYKALNNPNDGAKVYRLANSTDEVICTEIVTDKKTSFFWADMVYVGQVDEFIRSAFSYENPIQIKIKCDCGGAKAKTTHSHWCSTRKAMS